MTTAGVDAPAPRLGAARLTRPGFDGHRAEAAAFTPSTTC